MIPKTIHYCWFGGGAKSEKITKCLRSWSKYCPDYEIIEWNDSNVDIKSSPVLSAAYKARKYAFLSDVIRARALYDKGGIYVDTDVEIHRNLDRFLVHEAFTGFEMKGWCFTALWGSSPGHRLAELVLDYYDSAHIDKILSNPNTAFVSKIMEKEFGVDRTRDELQSCRDGLVVYPSNFFCVNLPEHYATHHFTGSWDSSANRGIWSDMVLATFYADSLRRLFDKGATNQVIGSGETGMLSDRTQLVWHLTQVSAIVRRQIRKRLTGRGPRKVA